MAGLEELKKRLSPLFDADKGLIGSRSNYRDSDLFSDPGSVNLIGSHGPYSINELACSSERTYLCASNEMRIFGSIGSGASSVVQRAIHIPTHRVLALKRINIFEEDKQRQLLTEIETLCEKACHNEVLVDFYGACFSPTSGHINIALEYVDGGSLADILRLKKSIPEPVLSALVKRILQGLSYLHGVRHLVHRDIKPANLLINLKGEPKITDFGISIGLDNSMAMCATFVGTVTYMSPERIRNESYSYSADIWSLGLCVFECASGEFPYAAAASEGPVNLMLEILEEASPSPPQHVFSPEFCSFIHACLHKDPLARSTADQLLSHPFITRYDHGELDLVAFARSVFDPVQRIKDLADMFAIHYYSILDGPDDMWTHAVSLYDQSSTFSFCGKEYVGAAEIFRQLSEIRSTLMGDWPPDRLVHVVERLHCRHGGDADTLGIRASGSFIVGNHFLICGDGLEAEGLPKFTDVDIDLSRMSLGTFQEEFLVMPSAPDRRYRILLQHLFIIKD